MKIRTLLLLTILLCPTLAFAQHDGMGQGYLFGAIGKSAYTSTTAQVGAGIGFERLFGPGIGAGLDFQGYGVGGRNGSYGGIRFTANGSYHFRDFALNRYRLQRVATPVTSPVAAVVEVALASTLAAASTIGSRPTEACAWKSAITSSVSTGRRPIRRSFASVSPFESGGAGSRCSPREPVRLVLHTYRNSLGKPTD